MIRLYLIRHAESEANTQHDRIGGLSAHSPLTMLGEQQARLLGERLARERIIFDRVYCSPAVRTTRTAELACAPLGITSIESDEKLYELRQGDWEGRPRSEIYTPKQLALINANNYEFCPPGGESQRAVEERLLQWWNTTGLARAKTDMTVAVFGHGMAHKCFLRHCIGFPSTITYRIQLANTSITELHHDDLGWWPIRMNDTAHLHRL